MYYDPSGLLHLDRIINSPVLLEDIDAYGGFWLFGVTDATLNHIAFDFENQRYAVSGMYGIFVPPYSIVHWHINPGRLRFHAYIGKEQFALENGMTRPMLIPVTNLEVMNLNQIQNVLLQAKDHCTLSTGKTHVVVQRAKAIIDRTFLDNCNIADVARQLRVDTATLSRMFKKYHGIPPVVYRNKLRVFYAKFRLATSCASVTESGYDAGFSDLATFNRQFRKIVSASPSQFKILESRKSPGEN